MSNHNPPEAGKVLEGEGRNLECCPKCGELSVTTFAFDGWESFCPDCKIGDGMFNGWPSRKGTQAEYEARKEDFMKRMYEGEYLPLRRLNSAMRREVEARIATSSARSETLSTEPHIETTGSTNPITPQSQVSIKQEGE